MNNLTTEEIRYQQALRRVKRIKGFYTHLMVYVVVNIGIIIANYTSNDYRIIWRWETFSTAIFWGIGLLAHAMSVFLPSLLMGKGWEERKIKELMGKDKMNKWE